MSEWLTDGSMLYSSHLTCTVKETFEDTFKVCLGLWRIVTVAFLRLVQIVLLIYLLTPLLLFGAYSRFLRE